MSSGNKSDTDRFRSRKCMETPEAYTEVLCAAYQAAKEEILI